MPRYTIRKNRILQSGISGFNLSEEGSLVLDEEKMFHGIFLRAVDCAEDEGKWGRISFNAKGADEAQICVYAFATDHRDILLGDRYLNLEGFLCDDDIEVNDKISLLKKIGAKRFVSINDCLVYDIFGRYLFVAIEVTGEGKVSISDIIIDSTGDNFMDTYPEIYRERNSFFHRYISIFSTIYNDFQRDIDALPKLLDLDICSEELLITYGNWMGLDLRGGFLETDILRKLVKEAYNLNRMKGTRKAMERILEIILGERAVIIEHNLVRAWLKQEDSMALSQTFRARGIYDVTILVKKHLSEELRHQILYILNQYKPLRTRIFLAQLDEMPTADSSSYLDINTRLPEEKEAALDRDLSLDNIVVLS